jgi:hypothetical protein
MNRCARLTRPETGPSTSWVSAAVRRSPRFRQQGGLDGIRHNGAVTEAHPAIRFLGVFDVVAAFGVANLGFVFVKTDVGHHLSLPATVEHCFHAMALDEKRPQFAQTRVKNGYEVWFRGVHSDIGGGNDNTGLNNVALRWMYRKALAAGLPVVMDLEDGGEADAARSELSTS